METTASEFVIRWMNELSTDVERPFSIRDDDNDTLSHSSFSSHNTESTAYAEDVPTVPPIIMGLSASSIKSFGCTLSSNGRSSVAIKEVFDHLDIPYYPKTSSEGVGHFVHFAEPLFSLDASKSDVFRIAREQMSKIQFSV
ncbi:hypothetical protein B0O99DRAFT_695204 [Bisporella sp. PMI_857]|nr:hypothetical protein B0O99DRAFT_695204 [Bisporella sp. PMI_857]